MVENNKSNIDIVMCTIDNDEKIVNYRRLIAENGVGFNKMSSRSTNRLLITTNVRINRYQ